jgi:hypothetical protein
MDIEPFQSLVDELSHLKFNVIDHYQHPSMLWFVHYLDERKSIGIKFYQNFNVSVYLRYVPNTTSFDVEMLVNLLESSSINDIRDFLDAAARGRTR